MKQIVILGAGFAGLTAAIDLDPLAASGEASVTLVDRSAFFNMGFSNQWVMMRRRTQEDGRRSYDSLKAPYVNFIRDEIIEIDTSSKTIHTKARTLNYDYLIVALGAELSPELVPGLAEGAYNICDANAVLQLRQSLEKIERGTIIVAVSSVPFKCPPAPYEYAMLIDDKLTNRGVRKDIRLVLTTPEPQPMPVAGKAVGDAVKELLEQRRIEFMPLHKPKNVEPKGRTVTYENGAVLDYSLLATMPPHRAPKVVRESGLTDNSGFVPAEIWTLETRISGIYAVGDVASLKLPNGGPHPKAGVFAENQALAVARNIISDIRGTETTKYSGTGVCFIDAGRNQASQARAELLAQGGPKFVFTPPSDAGLESKRNFEIEHFKKWFGS